jgi:hypothetical protein
MYPYPYPSIHPHGVMLESRINFIRPAVIPEEYSNQHSKCLRARVQKHLEPGRPGD